MYVVLTDRRARDFYGENNPRGIGPFLFARDALACADGDATKVVSVWPKAYVTDRYIWRDIGITEVVP